MKKLSKLLSVLICFSLLLAQIPLMVSAADGGALSFQALNDAWSYDTATDVYSTTAITNTHYITGDLEAGIAFEFQSSSINDFFFFNIGNADAVFPAGDGFFYDFCHGTGLKVLFHDNGWTQSALITATEAAGWNNPAWTANASGVAADFHDDGVWHTVSISKARGAWSVKVDGTELLSGLSAEQTATLNSLLDGDTGYIVVGANGHTGNVSVRETEYKYSTLDFVSMGTAWNVDETTDVYSTAAINNTHYMTGDLEAGVAFQFQSSNINDFFFFNIANTAAAFPTGDAFFYDFCHGTGLKVLFHDNGWTQSALITQTEAAGWNNPAWTANASGVAADFHDDNLWHTVIVSKASGIWSVKVDGTELLVGLDETQLATLNSLLDGDFGCIVVGANGHTGNVKVREITMAQAIGMLNFQSQGNAWNYNTATEVYSTAAINNTHYMTGNLAAGVEFEFKSSSISDFFFFNIANEAAAFPAGDAFFYDFCHGTGLKVLFHDNGWTQSALITQTEAAGWNNPAWTANASGVATDFHDDGVWHKVAISKASGAWSVKVDGTELLTGLSAEQTTTLNSLLDGDTGYIVVGANGHTGNVEVTQHVHKWTKATCTTLATCAICGITTGVAADHNYVDGSCSVCGATDPDAPTCAHEYTYPCDAHCALCGELTNPDAAHNIVHVDAVDKTCTENGNIEYWYCSDCGSAWADEALTMVTNRFNVVVPAAHTYDDNCDSECNICEEWRFDAPHNLTYVEGKVPANCQETGYDEHWVCEDCGAYFSDANAQGQLNPAWMYYTGEHVRPEGSIVCAVVACELCGEDSYGEACDRGDAPECIDTPCVNCGEICYGWGHNYNTGDEEIPLPLCQPGDCVYCGEHFEKLYDHENGAWAPCLDGECAYGCGLQYPATSEHVVEDPCVGGMCQQCWNEIAPAHDYVDGVCSGCGAKDGWVNNRYYVDGEAVKGLYQIGGDYYYFNTGSGKMMADKTIWVKADNGYGLAAGHYVLGTDGKLQVVKNGWLTNDKGQTFYYINDERVKGLYEIDGDYYYFNTGSGLLTVNKTIWVAKSNAYGLAAGNYELGADGKLVVPVLNGWVGNCYYVNDEAVKGVYEIDGKYYYFHHASGVLQTSKTVWIKADNACGLAAGNYELTADGVVVL